MGREVATERERERESGHLHVYVVATLLKLLLTAAVPCVST